MVVESPPIGDGTDGAGGTEAQPGGLRACAGRFRGNARSVPAACPYEGFAFVVLVTGLTGEDVRT